MKIKIHPFIGAVRFIFPIGFCNSPRLPKPGATVKKSKPAAKSTKVPALLDIN